MTEELRGVVKAVIFKSKDESYCVFRIEEKGSGTSVTVTGNIVIPYVGENVVVRGGWLRHPRFGLQFRAAILERMKPEAADEVEQFLASGLISGIGPSMAKRIVQHFGKKTLEIFERNIDALSEVPGIGQKTLERIKDSYSGISAMQEVIMFLQSLGISERFALPMQQLYGDDVMKVVREDPYRMVSEIPGLGFKNVDRIALSEGIIPEDSDRIVHGIFYILSQAVSGGHVCGPSDQVYTAASELLQVSPEIVETVGREAVDFGTVPSIVYEGKTYLYLPYLYEAETESAYRVHHLMEAGPLGSANLAIERFEKENGFRLAKEQRDAVEKSMKAGMMVITGGPGTGKTTLIRAIITAAEQNGLEPALMAPTGRAAKRLAISSGRDADTIHKALEASVRETGRTYFERNEANPLEEDLIIVDEASMLDISLFYHLLCALKDGARLILVGDIDQLPPVGAGEPLKDLMSWGYVPIVRLKRIFRQEEGSGIVENAALIRKGEMCVPDEADEFRIVYAADDEDAYRIVMDLCRELNYRNEENKMLLQVLSPMYRGVCGVDHLNESLQEMIHGEKVPDGMKFFPGDKVMQTRNDYEKGIYNGDVGTVWTATPQKVFVRYFDKEVVYEGEERFDLRLAYAVTVHKSQGSEYETVIFILRPSQHNMLQRNLLYTGVTRARKNTILVTAPDALRRALAIQHTGNRYSLFLPFLNHEAL